ncbi:MAG: hypothetical protein E7657_00800 [Ruminococcaceae bacterium]|nr:hypothetical protein [Oscillospiraceae bacterium]
MTGKDLYITVAQMGFARTLEENEPYFYRAANLSLARIARRFPVIAHYALPDVDGSKTAHFDIAALTEDFAGFPREPVFRDGAPLIEGRDFRIEGGCVFLARGLAGSFTVRYIHRPREITPDTPDETVDLPPYAESLLPPLCASYLWLDDRGELATHYLALYRTEAEELASTLNRHGGAALSFRNGWDKG